MRKIQRAILLLLLFLVITSVASLMIGTPFIALKQFAELLLGKGQDLHSLVVSEFRIPRLLISLVSGFSLGVSGYLLQGVTRNELADSSLLGINSGAGFFVMLYLGFYANDLSPFLLLLVAFFGGVSAALLVYIIARKRNGLLGMNRILLAGIAVNAGLSALMFLCTIKLSKENYGFVNTWIAGSIWGASWPYVWVLIPWTAGILLLTVFFSGRIGLLSLGQERARSLGLNVTRSQQILLLVAVALACGSVAVAGSLSFVGLLAPHAAKLVMRQESQWKFLLSGLFGALFVNSADIIARIILPSGEIPTGILIAVIGAPYFLYLLLSKQKQIIS